MLRTTIFAATLAAGAASAATYTDQSAFLADVTVEVSEDFESLGTDTFAFDGPYVAPSGITVSSGTDQLLVAGPGQSSNPTTAIGSNNPSEALLTLSFGDSYTAFGADVFQNYGGGLQSGETVQFTVTFLAGNDVVGFEAFPVASDGGSFFGYTSAAAFDSAVVSAPFLDLFGYAGFEVVDNVLLGSVAVIPVPASLGLLAAALGALGLARRRRA